MFQSPTLRLYVQVAIYSFVFGCLFSIGMDDAAGQQRRTERTPPAYSPKSPNSARAQNTTAATRPANSTPVAGNPQTGTPPAVRQQVAKADLLPDPFQLTPKEKERLDMVLGFWQGRSAKVKTYECKFVRWEYDNVFGPADPRLAKSQAEGIMRYAAPDKGEFKVEKIGEYNPANKDPKQKFVLKPSNHDEHWICDGRSVFELNGKTKTLREERLPPEMQGKSIAAGPLPFMFGAKKDELLARYWMKELVPPKGRGEEYWIEARPKFRDDAANFQKILVILDQEHFLPTAMQVFPPTWDGRKNLTRTVYAFNNRKVNDPLHLANQRFLRRFISPKPPRGWKRVVNNVGGNPPQRSPMNAKAPNGNRTNR